MASFERDPRLEERAHGRLYVSMLEDSDLPPLARLMWGVLNSFGKKVTARKFLIAKRMGFKESSLNSVDTYLVVLVQQGFLQVIGHRGRGRANRYRLTMPEWCFIENGEDRRAAKALAVQLPPVPAKWAPAGREDQPQRRLTMAARRARRPLGLPAGPSEGHSSREGLEGVSAALENTASQPYLKSRKIRPASRSRNGQPAVQNTASQPFPTVEPISGNYQLKLGEVVEAPQPVDLLSSSNPLELKPGQTPAGWEGYASQYHQRARRRFYWTSKNQAVAADINQLLGQPQLVKATWSRFISSPRFMADGRPGSVGTHKPLEALRKYLHEFTPDEEAPARACRHGLGQIKSTQTVAHEIEGVRGKLNIKNCSCGEEVREFIPDPTADQLAAYQRAADQLRAMQFEATRDPFAKAVELLQSQGQISEKDIRQKIALHHVGNVDALAIMKRLDLEGWLQPAEGLRPRALKERSRA